MTDARLRPGTDRDRNAIAALQIRSWQDTYRGLVPQDFLDARVPPALTELWHSRDLTRWPVHVAEAGGRIVRFFCLGRRSDDSAYLDNMHVLASHAGQGIGRALMIAAFETCRAWRINHLELTVLADNTAALSFYERLGGEVGETFSEDLMGLTVRARPVRWRSLTHGQSTSR